MKYALLLMSLVLLLAGCAHTAASGRGADQGTQAGRADDAGSPDAILGSFDEPRREKKEEAAEAEAPPPVAAAADDEEAVLVEGADTEDSLLSTVDPRERKAGSLEVDEPDELDPSEEREDSILSVLDSESEKECDEDDEDCEPGQQERPEQDEEKPPGRGK